MNPPLVSALLAVMLPSLAFAAPQECRVRALVLQAGATSEQLHAHAEAGTATAGVVTVKTFLNHEFDTLKLKLTGAKLAFTTKPEPASAKDEAARIGTCEIPAKAKSVILLFIPKIPAKPACRVVVVDDSAKTFPPGSIDIVNLSSLEVKFQLEDQSFEFMPGEIRAIPNPPAGPNQASAMKGFCRRAGKPVGEWENFASGAWPHPGDKRVLQILTDNPATNQVEIRGVRDVAKP